MIIYSTKKVSSVEDYITGIEEGYFLFKYPSDIRQSINAKLDELKDTSDKYLFVYLYEKILNNEEDDFPTESTILYLANKLVDENDLRKNFIIGLFYYFRQDTKEEAFHFLSLSAKAGFIMAEDLIAWFYQNGIVVDKDFSQCYKLYRHAAKAGLAIAQLDLGYCYQEGIGTEQNPEKAFEWYKKAAKQNLALAMNKLGDCYYNGEGTERDFDKAFEWYSRAADENAEALCSLGDCYRYGNGTDEDPEKAFECYQESLEKGYDFANARLGECYYDGIGIDQDYKKAFECYNEAAEDGYCFAQKKLGDCYYYGEGTERDFDKAFEWYSKASEGYAEALCGLGDCYRYGNGTDEDPEKAFECYQESLEKGYDFANARLGDCYSEGIGVDQDLKKAFGYYQEAAEKGYFYAQNKLGDCYYNGDGTERDFDKAFEWYSKASEGNTEALCSLGDCYRFGNGTKQDPQKAFELYKESAELGAKFANVRLGDCYDKGIGTDKDPEKAFEYYSIAAEDGYFYAQNKLGDCYYNGDGTERDFDKAFEWYSKASEGNAEALCGLGDCYRFGNGVKQDPDKAFELYKKSLNSECRYANVRMGDCYNEGIGVDKDPEKAFEYYSIAAEYGYYYAQNKLGDYYYYGNEDQENLEKAFEWYSKAAEGNNEAICMLGDCYRFGNGVKQDPNKAFDYYKESAEKGYDFANARLGDCYYNGIGVKKDLQKAFEYYSKAAEDGYYYAQNKVGDCYYYGEGVNEDDEKAFEWYSKAAEGNSEAQLSLAGCYRFGRGIKQDYDKAFELYKKAAENKYWGGLTGLGDCYFYGYGVDKDQSEAFKLYKEAAEYGYSVAQCLVGDCYNEGVGIEKDPQKAFEWYSKAAEQGDLDGLLWVGRCYQIGTGVEKDPAKAFEWYSKAAEDETDAFAQGILGDCYAEGVGVPIDYDKALYYYKKSLDLGYTEAQEEIDEVKKLIEEKAKLSSVDIFISWNHNDKDIKDEIRDYLTNNGIKVWETDKDSQGELDGSVKNAIEKSKGYIILLSPNSFKSNYMPGEVKAIFEKIGGNKDLEKTIRIQVVGNADEVTKQLNELPDDHPFKALSMLTMAFNYNLDDILAHAQRVVAFNIIEKYQMQLREKYGIFPISLSNVILKQADTNIITTLELENGYINRDLLDIDGNRYGPEDILNIKKNILIVAEGGAGKSLYMKNLIHRYSKDEKLFFYFPCSELKETIRNNPDIDLNGLIEKLFSEITNSDKMPSYVADAIFRAEGKKVYIIIDALDEADKEKDEIINLVNDYQAIIENKNAHFIFTSRNADLGKINTPYIQLSLNHLTDEDVIELFDTICKRNNISKQKSDASLEGNGISRDAFIETLKNMSEDIKKNPLLISNVIYIYFATKKIERQKSFIVEQSSNLLIESLSDRAERERNALENLQLDIGELLEFIAFSSNVRDASLDEIVGDYLESRNIASSKETIESLCKYLRRKGIVVGHTLSHGIYSSYFASKYIYRNVYTMERDPIFLRHEIVFAKDGKDILRTFIEWYLKLDEGLWPDITTNLVVKIDYQIHHLYKNGLSERSKTYQTLHETMKEMVYDPPIISETAKQVLKDICQKDNMIYFPDIIGSYLK